MASAIVHNSQGSGFPAAVQTDPVSVADLLSAVTHSAVLSEVEKKYYLAMIHCVAQYGIGNDQELFQAAGYCFDRSFGSHTKSIIKIEDFLTIMGAELDGKTLGDYEDYISAEFFAHNRPGFFLLTPDNRCLFLKEGEAGTLVYYDSLKNEFVDASSMSITGKEKLVILNQTVFPKPKAYCAAETPDPVQENFYHEEQEAGKCGIHATHAFVGFPFIDETALSLNQLEYLVNHRYDQEVPSLRGVGNSEEMAKLLPPSQITHYKNTARFKLAQGTSFGVESGTECRFIFQQLKEKYPSARTYSIHIEQEDGAEGQHWNVDRMQCLLGIISEELSKNKYKIEAIDRKIDEFEKSGVNASHPRHKEYMDMWAERDPFTALEMRQKRIGATLQGLKELESQFQRSDRLLIFSHKEIHTYAMRKCTNGDWVVIDSINSEQTRTSDPLKWLTDRQMEFYQFSKFCHCDFITL